MQAMLRGVPFYEKYNLNLNVVLRNELELELYCYRWNDALRRMGGSVVDRTEHFKAIVNILWGEKNKVQQFVFNPWAEKMIAAFHAHKYPALSGCASSGKSEVLAVYALVNWLCAPAHTLVLATSTDLKAAQRRIWGAIERYWLAAPGLPGRMVSSKYQIYTIDDKGQKLSGQCGIDLVAGDKKQAKESMAKLIGAKAPRVFLLLDEMPELNESLVSTALENLISNDNFQMIGVGNFKSRYDPFGKFCQPKAGWESVSVNDDEWETELGWCARFDGLKSPNILAGEYLYKGIYNSKTLKAHREDLGENTAGFWRMCRSFEAPIGMDDALYSESDFIAGRAYDVVGRDVPWTNRFVRISALDPSFTNGGDRSVQWFAWYGQIKDAQGGELWVLAFDRMLLLREDVRIRDKTRSRQIAEQFRDNCINEGVSPRYAALDATAGGGKTLADLIAEVWSPEVLRVDFSGAPSDLFIGDKPAKAMYDRRVSELWGVGAVFMRYGQLKGITPSLAREMKARKKEHVKGPDGLRTKVETKEDMKVRLGFSPDEADGAFVGIELARKRLKFVAGGANSAYVRVNANWAKQCKTANSIYEHAL